MRKGSGVYDPILAAEIRHLYENEGKTHKEIAAHFKMKYERVVYFYTRAVDEYLDNHRLNKNGRSK